MRWPKAIKSFNPNKIAPQLILCSLQTCQWLHNENFNSCFWENEKSWNSGIVFTKKLHINTIGYIKVSGNAFACTELKLSLDKKCSSILRRFSFHLTGVAHQLTVERWWCGGCCGCCCCRCGCCRCSCRCGRLWGFHKWSFFVNQSMISVKRKLSSIPGMQQSL